MFTQENGTRSNELIPETFKLPISKVIVSSQKAKQPNTTEACPSK